MLWRAIPGAARVFRTIVSAGNRRFGQRRGMVTLPNGATVSDYRRWVVVLAMVCAAVACVALALSAASVDIGAGMVSGGAIALCLFYRQRLRRW